MSDELNIIVGAVLGYFVAFYTIPKWLPAWKRFKDFKDKGGLKE